MIPYSDYRELKIGKLASYVLRKMLEDGMASEFEIRYMQQSDYSKQFFGLNYPLLVREGSNFEKVRYYKIPLIIYGERYYLCSQWFETEANNDRPFLEKWIRSHQKEKGELIPKIHVDNEIHHSESNKPLMDNYLKIGKLAMTVFGPMLEEGRASDIEIKWMQDAEYSKNNFGLNYPLLVPEEGIFEDIRYYN